jgi:hypothetical protein
VWKDRQGRKKAKGHVMLVMRLVTVKMRGLNEVTEREENERSGGIVRMTVEQKGREVEGHGVGDECDWRVGRKK